MRLWSICVGEIRNQLVTAGAFQQQINVWGWNQQPIPIINQWKFCQQEDVLLRRWLVFQIQRFLPSAKPSNRQAHLAGAQRSKKLSGNLQWWLDASSQMSIQVADVYPLVSSNMAGWEIPYKWVFKWRFPKMWVITPNHPKLAICVLKPMVLGLPHFRKPPNGRIIYWWGFSISTLDY